MKWKRTENKETKEMMTLLLLDIAAWMTSANGGVQVHYIRVVHGCRAVDSDAQPESSSLAAAGPSVLSRDVDKKADAILGAGGGAEPGCIKARVGKVPAQPVAGRASRQEPNETKRNEGGIFADTAGQGPMLKRGTSRPRSYSAPATTSTSSLLFLSSHGTPQRPGAGF